LPDYPALPGSWFGKKGCSKDIGFIYPDKACEKKYIFFCLLTDYNRNIDNIVEKTY
jgi:hypothetical protein